MLSPGDRLGPYEVVSSLGAGGMGEVYRARDTRLGREVAVKVLPEAVADSADRLRRFEREARATAALSHPNVLSVFDVGSQSGRAFVVTELLEGGTVASMLRGGAFPVRKALDLAAQAARGLAAAHAKGIVHRDLKPDNLFLTATGVMKILDFGLARLRHGDAGDSQAATESNATASGTVLGTLSYMSPEQAKGLSLDARSDIFSLGVVLHEMLSGRHPFRRTSTAETVSAILRDEPPDLGAAEGRVPGPVEGLVRRCLEKRPEDRFQTASDLALALDLLAGGDAIPEFPEYAAAARNTAAGRRRFRVLLGAGTAVAAILALATVAHRWIAPIPGHQRPPVHFTFEVEDEGVRADEISVSRGTEVPGLVALHPRGSGIAYRVRAKRESQLHLRWLDQAESAALPGTEGAYAPFFSTDGKWLGFFTEGRLKKISTEALAVETVARAPGGWSGAYGPRGDIFFAPRQGPIARVPAGGGAPDDVTRLEPGERSHRWPTVLPDGKTLIFESVDSSETSRILAESLETGQRKTLLEEAGYPRFASSGHLVFVRPGHDSLFAVPLDLPRVEVAGSAVEVIEHAFGVRGSSGTNAFDISANGTLAYIERSGGTPVDGVLWFVDRSGHASPIADLKRAFAYPRLSPDGRRLAVTILDEHGAAVWVYNIARQSLTRLTFNGRCQRAIWTPDGRRLTYQSDRSGSMNLYSEPFDGSGPVERLTTSDSEQCPGSWSPDGRTLSFSQRDPGSSPELWLLTAGRPPRRTFGSDEAAALGPKWDGPISPDGRLIAYTSLESGRLEVYVRLLRGSGKRQVSTEGGNSPVWARSGKELFYLNGGRLMAVPIESGPEPKIGRPRLLFEGDYSYAGTVPNYDVAPDDQSFVMIRGERRRPWMRVHVVLNWSEELKRRVPRRP